MDEGMRLQLERARAGDGEAFAALFRTCEEDVTRLCRRLLGDPHEAEDAAAETFLRARGGLSTYDASRSFRTWLLAVGAHLCVDRLRRRQVERRLFANADLADDLAAAGPTPLAGVLRAETRRTVLAAIEALPDRYRAPIVLRYFADLDYAAVAEILEVSRDQVGTLLLRARRRLRATLAEDAT